MTVSMRVMSAGEGYRYLLKSVVANDGNRDLSASLVDYYTREGTPPGFWLGAGVRHLGDGQLRAGEEVTEPQLRRLLGHGRDPVTDGPLGHAYPTYLTRQQRIRSRIDALDPNLSGEQRAAAVAGIEGDESERKSRRAVAGYDFTFSAPKSVSVLWALADPDTRARIVEVHHAAIADVIGLMERQVAATRMGANTTDGAVAQVEVQGLIATGYDHYDSRAGDPQLHTHVVISNKVRTVLDGKWRSLDSRGMHAAVVGLSEYYNTVLADRLTCTLGIGWDARDRGRDRNPGWEIAGVPQRLIEAFSSRSSMIEVEKDRLIEQYRTGHGHIPSSTTIIRLREQATLATRADKTVQSLRELTATWHARAAQTVNGDVLAWRRGLLDRRTQQPTTHAADVTQHVIDTIGRRVVEVVGEKRSTWSYWNLHAEASRQTIGLRFTTTTDREAVVERIVAAAEGASLRLTPPDLAATPPEFTRPDGTSVFRPKHSTVFTSADLLEAEGRLLKLGRTTTGPTVPLRNIDFAVTTGHDGQPLGDDQAAALVAVGSSARTLDVLVGPAGAGKTTAMRALRTAWELSHGPGTVVGLAPSAAAAQVLADDLGIATDNTAKWLYDHTAGTTGFTAGQLAIIDEASLAGTRTLDRITAHAAAVGAKVLLVGDSAQLAAIEAGGAFGMLVRDRTDPPELTDVHRFHHAWEKHATLQLRNGNIDVLDTYQTHDRIRGGDTDTMLQEVYRAWRDDLANGRSSLMVAHTQEAVAELNRKARDGRILSGDIEPGTAVRLRDQTLASAGDIIITRRNNRRLTAGQDWVKNGDRWTVVNVNDDASITARPADHPADRTVRLPADYVTEHVELGYAVTAHRAQGTTVDTSHTIVQPGMSRETLYVAMTRGRHANTAYVATDQPDTEAHHDQQPTGQAVLASVLRNVRSEQSAHDALQAEQDRWTGIAQLAAEYETIAAAAQYDRWVSLVRRSGLTPQQVDTVINSIAFGPLCAQLRRAEASDQDPDTLLPRLISTRPLDDADIGALLHHRLSRILEYDSGRGLAGRQPIRLIAGLIPRARGAVHSDLRRALDERERLIETTAQQLAHEAMARREPWIHRLGTAPPEMQARYNWTQQVQTIAAYRWRWVVTTDDPLGSRTAHPEQRADLGRATAALQTARQLSSPDRPSTNRRRRQSRDSPSR